MRRRRRLITVIAALVIGALALTTSRLTLARTSDVNVAVVSHRPLHVRRGGPGGLGTDGTALTLHEVAQKFVGINAPMAASTYALGLGCGDQIDPAVLFALLPPNAIVRVWFTQYLATNHATGLRDWSSFDRVVTAAEQAPTHPQLIVSLANQSGDCDSGTWRGRSWYAGGWDRDPEGQLPQRYGDFVRATVERYKNSPAVGIWEPVNEPEPSDCAAGSSAGGCYGHLSCAAGAATVLRSFYDGVGTVIRSIDGRRPISSGSLGGEQCGWGADSNTANSSTFVDIMSYHDYTAGVGTSRELQTRLDEAQRLDKPLLIGESGMAGRDVLGCLSTADRAQMLDTKMGAALTGGAAAYVLWVYGARGPAGCDLYILPGDPLWHVLATMTAGANGRLQAGSPAIRS